MSSVRTSSLFRATLAALLAAACILPFAVVHAADLNLTYIGQQIVPARTRFLGTTVGGLSSLDYNPLTGRYLAISDDRSKIDPARFYELSLDLSQFRRTAAPGMAGVTLHAVTFLQPPGGGTFKRYSVDPEGLRIDVARNVLYWSSEGYRVIHDTQNPTVREMYLDGSHVRDFDVPGYYHPNGPGIGLFRNNQGVYDNLGFESLALSIDGRILYTATENGLAQDSDRAGISSGSRARILAFGIGDGKPVAEYVYDVEPVPSAPHPFLGFAANGLTDLVAIGDRQFIAIERAFVRGAALSGGLRSGFTVRLYHADARRATNVSGMASIAEKNVQAVEKTLLLDLADLKQADGSELVVGNIEGITLGPRHHGRRTLILVADDNFSKNQLTQFIALEIDLPEDG